MNRITATLALAAVALLASGCAATDEKTPAAEARPTPQYRTGSNIPIKEAQPATPEERDRAAEEIRRIQRTGSSGKPGG